MHPMSYELKDYLNSINFTNGVENLMSEEDTPTWDNYHENIVDASSS